MQKGNKEARNKAQKLEEELGKKGLSEEKIEEIIRATEADLDRQEKELKAQIIEISPRNK